MQQSQKKGVKVIKLPFIYVFVGGKGLSVFGSVKLRISVFLFRYPWADPDLAGIFRSLKEHCHSANGPEKPNKAKKKKMEKNRKLKDESCS